MTNPFQYGGVVRGDAFCNRKKELRDLLRAMENGEKLFVYSERRFGKTSLAQLALERLPKGRYRSAYVDLWSTDSELTFVAATARAITESLSVTSDKLLEMAKQFFSRLAPNVTLDHEGRPKLTFRVSGAGRAAELDEVLAAPAEIAAHTRKRVVLVFDEIQQILEYETDLVERRLRSFVQQQEAVSYIFLGSRKHLIQRMFTDRSRPLYRAAGHYPLGPIDEQDWFPFIRDKFLNSGKRIADAEIRAVSRLTEGHPFYTQHLCHALWELSERDTDVTGKLIDSAIDLLLERERYAYTALWESLAMNQRRFLKGLASEPGPVQPFAGEFVRKYGLRSASNAQRAVAALLEKDVIDRHNGSFLISDRFFKIWIQRMDLGG